MAQPKLDQKINAPASVLGKSPINTESLPKEPSGGGKLAVSPQIDKSALDSKSQGGGVKVIATNDAVSGKSFSPESNSTIPKPQTFR